MSLPKLVNSFELVVHSLKRRVNCQLSIVNCPSGFSLIELLVVIAIIGLLASFGLVSFTNAQQKGRDGGRKADLKAVQQALELYFQVNGRYPATNSSGEIVCNTRYTDTGTALDSSAKTWGVNFGCDQGSTTSHAVEMYMQELRKDPTNQLTNGYYYNSNNTASPPNSTYVISANLENSSDPDLAGLPCTPQPSRNYCVIQP